MQTAGCAQDGALGRRDSLRRSGSKVLGSAARTFVRDHAAGTSVRLSAPPSQFAVVRSAKCDESHGTSIAISTAANDGKDDHTFQLTPS